MNYIEIKNLNKTINEVQVLKNINLSLEKNKIYGFLGHNGSGKTMLFRAICGLIKGTSGTISVDNKILHKDISFPENLGVIIESPGFWEQYTGFENLKNLALIQNKITDNEIKESLIRVGLAPKDKRLYKKYSLGMKQKLAIAQAIMEKPKLLILDEPTNALDEESVENVRKILLEEKKRGATILIASHNKDDIEILSDFKFKISNGEIIHS